MHMISTLTSVENITELGSNDSLLERQNIIYPKIWYDDILNWLQKIDFGRLGQKWKKKENHFQYGTFETYFK